MDEEKLINEILQDIENEENNGDVPVVENQTAEKDLKKQKKAERKKAKQKKYPDKVAFFAGFIILVFAVVGIVFSVITAVNYFKGDEESKTEYSEYNNYLAPVAAVDIDNFDDITAADKEQLISAALWLILSKDTTPDTYPYSNGYMLIPSADVEEAYKSLFGPETANSFSHMTVQGYNSVFEYDETNGVYKIPVTTISPVYIPDVTAVEQTGTSLIVTVEYLSAESWMRDDAGNFTAPEADKVMQITLREFQGGYYIGAIRTISSTIPETVTSDNVDIEEEIVSTEVPETTTIGESEKTTLGGRV